MALATTKTRGRGRQRDRRRSHGARGEAGGEQGDATDGEADGGADGTTDDRADAAADGETEGQPGGGDDGAAGGEADGAADAGDGGEAVDTTISENPLSIALMVADAGALTAAGGVVDRRCSRATATRSAPFTVTAEPIVNAVNNPGIDLLLFSPSFEFSLLYFPSDPNSLPMLDMARYSWYRRYMLPWGDDVVGPRFSGFGETSTEVFYDNTDVIEWDQPVGPVEVLTAPRFGGEAAMREVMDYSTGGAAQYFLRHVGDTGAEAALGVYVPPGSTITMPAPTAAEEQRFTSVAPWMGLLVFVDDPGDGNQYLEMTPAGEGLFEAAMQRLMNP